MATEIFPGVVRFDFPKDLAKKVIKSVNKSNLPWQDSAVGAGRVAKHVRSSETFGLDNIEISKEVRDVMIDCVRRYCEYYNVEVNGDDGLSLLRYQSYDKYDYHVDDGPNLQRVVSCLIYLNPGEYEGGGTTFKHFNHTINPDSPSLVLFPSNYPYLHAADPVSKGTKYIVVTWLLNKQI